MVLSLSSSAADDNGDGHLVFIFLLTAVTCGIATRYTCSRLQLRIPYRSLLLIVTCLVGLAQFGSSQFASAEFLMTNVNPRLVQYIFLPILNLANALDIHIRHFKRSLPVILLLLVPGTIITLLLTSVAMKYAFVVYDWDWITCLLVSGSLMAVDTAMVVRSLRKAGVAERLTTIIEGEATLNSCIAYILTALFVDVMSNIGSTSFTAAHQQSLNRTSLDVGIEIGQFVQVIVLSPMWGIALATAIIFFLYRVINDSLIEITTVIATAYVCFVIGNYFLNVNGNLAVAAFGLHFSQWQRNTISPDVFSSLHHTIQCLEYMASTLIYAIIGVISAYYLFVSRSIDGTDFGYCCLLYLFLLVTRGISAILLLPVLRFFKLKISYKEVAMIAWSGLRGHRCLILGLTIALNHNLDPTVSHRIVFLVCGTVFLTTLINGTLTQTLIRIVSLRSDIPTERQVLSAAVNQMWSQGNEWIDQMKQSPAFEAASWPCILRRLTSVCETAMRTFDQTYGTVAKPSASTTRWASLEERTSSSSVQALSTLVNGKQRRYLVERFLEWQRTEYHRLYDSGCLSRAASAVLLRSIVTALERGDLSHQWQVIEAAFRVPCSLSYLYSRRLLRQFHRLNAFLDRQVFLHLYLCLEVSTAFMGAAEQLPSHFDKFPVFHSSDIMQDIQLEASVYAKRARLILEDLKESFSPVYTALHTRHSSITLLMAQKRTLMHLHRSGLLSTLEFERLFESIQNTYIQLKRSPVENLLPSTRHVFLSQEYIRHLLPAQQERLLARGQPLLLPPSVWLMESMKKVREVGVYFVLRGQLATYYLATDGFVSGGSVNDASLSDTHNWTESNRSILVCTGFRSSPPDSHHTSTGLRIRPGNIAAAHSVLDVGFCLAKYKTITTCELLFLSPSVIGPALQSDARFRECMMRAAGVELFRSSFAHLTPYSEMQHTGSIPKLVAIARYGFYQEQEKGSDFCPPVLPAGMRVLLIAGHAMLEGSVSTKVESPSLIRVVQDRVRLLPLNQVDLLMWTASEEYHIFVNESEATSVRDVPPWNGAKSANEGKADEPDRHSESIEMYSLAGIH